MAKTKDPEMQAMQEIQRAFDGDDNRNKLPDESRDRVISWINARWPLTETVEEVETY